MKPLSETLERMITYKNYKMQDLQNALGRKEPSSVLTKNCAMNAAQAEFAIAIELLAHYQEEDSAVNITSMVSCLFDATLHPEGKKLLKKALQSVLDNVKTS